MDAPLEAVLLLAAAFAGGAVNAVAGGGTLLTFPVLLALGLPSVIANATSTVGLVSGSMSGAWAYRRELGEVRAWLWWLVAPSLLGGVAGALLLLRTPPPLFDALVPFLILGATVLFAAGEWLGPKLALSADGRPASLGRKWGVAAAQAVIATYGGYFGAGMGILMLAAFALLHLGSIHRANALKTVVGAVINGVAAAVFVARGVVWWPEAAVMIVGSVVGGYAGASLARRVGQKPVRRFVVLVGVTAAVVLGVQRFG